MRYDCSNTSGSVFKGFVRSGRRDDKTTGPRTRLPRLRILYVWLLQHAAIAMLLSKQEREPENAYFSKMFMNQDYSPKMMNSIRITNFFVK